MKTIVLYSDEIYFHHVVNTIESFRRVNDRFNFIYFQVDFNLPVFLYDMEVKCVSIEKTKDVPHMQLMKPTILRLALDHCDDFVYVDCDGLASKNFNYDFLISKVEKYPYGPLLHETSWQRPVYFWTNGSIRYELDESKMMEHLNVNNRTQVWVTTLLLAINKNCKDFISEWESLCNDSNLWDGSNELEKINMGNLPPFRLRFHMGDETPFNVLLWKYGAEDYYVKSIILEPKKLLTFLIVENLKIKDTRIEDENPLSDVNDSKKVYFYHQLKDLNFRIEVLNELYKNE